MLVEQLRPEAYLRVDSRHDLHHEVCAYELWCQYPRPSEDELLLQVKDVLVLDRYEIVLE